MGPLTLHNISEAHMSGQYCFKRTFLTDFAGGISVSNIIQGLFLGKHTIEKFCDSKGRCKMWREAGEYFSEGSSDMLLNNL